MTKIFLKNKVSSKNYAREQIKKTLSKNHACYVLITCSDPSEDGKMDVEMSYDGDETLASYLLQSAQNIFDENLDTTADSCQD